MSEPPSLWSGLVMELQGQYETMQNAEPVETTPGGKKIYHCRKCHKKKPCCKPGQKCAGICEASVALVSILLIILSHSVQLNFIGEGGDPESTPGLAKTMYAKCPNKGDIEWVREHHAKDIRKVEMTEKKVSSQQKKEQAKEEKDAKRVRRSLVCF